MEHKGWALRIYENPGIMHLNMGPHFYFWNGDPEEITAFPMFSSPHANILGELEADKAYARLQALLRLASGLSMMISRWDIHISDSLYYFTDDSLRSKSYSNDDLSIIIQELNNPFDYTVTFRLKTQESQYYKPITQATDYAQLLVDDPLVREVVLLLSLAREQPLYLLINAHKILDTLKNDLGLREDKKKDENKNKKLMPNSITESYPFDSLFKLHSYTAYMNMRTESGLLSRHGLSTQTKPAKTVIHPSSMNEVMEALVKSVCEWVDYKCDVAFGRKYLSKSSQED